jgi:hypothetical protein
MNYQLGKIYKLTSPHTECVYIGSTANSLIRRLTAHKSDYNRFINGISSSKITSVLIMCKGDVSIELIENYPCNSRKELTRREGEIQKQYDQCVNKNIAGRTQAEIFKEWVINNKEKYDNYQKVYQPKYYKEKLKVKRMILIDNNKQIVDF